MSEEHALYRDGIAVYVNGERLTPDEPHTLEELHDMADEFLKLLTAHIPSRNDQCTLLNAIALRWSLEYGQD